MASPKNAKVLLSFLNMHSERDMLFEDVPLDNVLRRLVAGVWRRVEEEQGARDVMAAVERANVMFQAWKQRDKGRVLQFLSEQCIQQARTGHAVDEEMLAQIEALGGPEARANTEQRCSRFERVSAEELPQRVEEIAERARWDAMRERVAAGDIEGMLFPLLRDLQQGICAVLGAAPRAEAQFRDKFDVDFLLQQHRAGSLSRADIGNYASYVAEMVGRVQAPADDAVVQPWVTQVVNDAHSGSSLQEYLPSLVDLVRWRCPSPSSCGPSGGDGRHM